VEPRVSIVVFPGSNCEQDCMRAFGALGADTRYVWHGDSELPPSDIVVLPGGFAHGDYLRTGALARFSPIMDAVRDHAGGGGLVIGICNGFQILCEAGLLPGALRRNAGLTFLCKWEELEVATRDSAFTSGVHEGATLRIPINHFEGNWYCDPQTLEEMRAEDRVILRYKNNPNGSMDDVAGICNEGRNVFGLMPHPERASEEVLGSRDGNLIFGSMLDWVRQGRTAPLARSAL
jgi:phosphoribosylformylglycinamidine synthase subunit PurQ / glutaminase